MNILFPYLKFSFVLLSAVFMLGCGDGNQEKCSKKSFTYKVEKDFSLQGKSGVISIENSSRQQISFQLKINDLFPLEMEDVMSEINRISEQDSSSELMAAWEYTFMNTFHEHSFEDADWAYYPLIFLNSIGGGLCDDRATVLAELWKNMNYKARIVFLEDHVVPEVFANKKWQMLDPDKHVYYKNNRGQMASVEELKKNPDLVEYPGKIEDYYNVYTFANTTTRSLAEMYSKSDLEYVKEWEMENLFPDTICSLPSHSVLNFHIRKWKCFSAISLDLDSSSKGLVSLPFLPYYATGNIQLEMNENEVKLASSDTLWFSLNDPIVKFDVIDAGNEAQIVFLVNPKLTVLKDANHLQINSDGKLGVHISDEIRGNYLSVFDFQMVHQKMLMDSILFRTRNAFLIQSEKYQGQVVENYLKEELEKYLKSDKKLTNEQKQRMRKNLMVYYETFLLEANLEGQQALNALNTYHPIGLYYLLSALRFENLDLITNKYEEIKQSD